MSHIEFERAKELYGPNCSAVSQQLSQQAQTVAEYLLPNGRRKKSEWLVGSVQGEEGSSLRVELEGARAGLWVDHADDSQKGDLIDLWVAVTGTGKSHAFRAARDWLGLQPEQRQPKRQPRMNKKKRKSSQQIAQELWSQGEAATEHGYTTAKGLEPTGLRIKGDLLLIPMYDSDRALTCVQTINPNPAEGEQSKKFAYGCKAKDCYLPLRGPDESPLVICEGWATGQTINLAGYAVAVAFSSGNLVNVARIMRNKFPDREIILAPDNDKNQVAVKKAEQAAAEFDCLVCVPEVKNGSDFDDLRQQAGLKEVNRQLKENRLDPWPEVEQLPSLMLEVDPFDYDLLPAPLKPYVEYCARNISCPPEFIATAAMVSAGTLIGRKVCIRPKIHEPWTVVPNLWGANIGISAQAKTPGQDKGLLSIYQLDDEAWREHETEQKEQAALNHQRDAEKAALKQTLTQHYKKKNRDNLDAEYTSRRIAELETIEQKLAPKRYWTSDPTIEKLTELLNENPNGLLLVRDELMGWLKQLERHGREADRPFYLECHSGKGRAYHDRIGRGTVRCDNMCLSIHGSIQPGPLREYVIEALGRGAGADGLLQRFQLMVWPDFNGDWDYSDEPLDNTVLALADSMFRKLDQLTPQIVGATIPENDLPYLQFTDEAQAVYIEWATDLHRNKLTADEHEAFQSHLGKYEALMTSLALIIHISEGGTGPVDLKATLKACAWCDFLESHARRVYAPFVHPELMAATRLARKISAGEIVQGMTVRDIVRKNWSGIGDKKRAIKALELLEDYGWLRVLKEQTGGRPTEVISIHPQLRKVDHE